MFPIQSREIAADCSVLIPGRDSISFYTWNMFCERTNSTRLDDLTFASSRPSIVFKVLLHHLKLSTTPQYSSSSSQFPDLHWNYCKYRFEEIYADVPVWELLRRFLTVACTGDKKLFNFHFFYGNSQISLSSTLLGRNNSKKRIGIYRAHVSFKPRWRCVDYFESRAWLEMSTR